MVFKLIRIALAEDNDIHGLRQIKGVYDMSVGFNVGFFGIK